MKRLFPKDDISYLPLRVIGGFDVTGWPMEYPELVSAITKQYCLSIEDDDSSLVGFRLVRLT